ncbi:WW domain [Phaffia rhodozyma]|uniref:WW domain n=1 Tax=Phaffia rhodozyma TaxID=264483 RepID=A0A0F7SH60_PHARH|nr:WW domain [Phaffia rhodozyma]
MSGSDPVDRSRTSTFRPGLSSAGASTIGEGIDVEVGWAESVLEKITAQSNEQKDVNIDLPTVQEKLDGIEIWQKHFWVTIQDENSIFYSNPKTGTCSWKLPRGVYVLPIASEGQWWELSDYTQDGLVYYYHTKTKQTQWRRPDVPLIIPLALTQFTSLGFFDTSKVPATYLSFQSAAQKLQIPLSMKDSAISISNPNTLSAERTTRKRARALSTPSLGAVLLENENKDMIVLGAPVEGTESKGLSGTLLGSWKNRLMRKSDTVPDFRHFENTPFNPAPHTIELDSSQRISSRPNISKDTQQFATQHFSNKHTRGIILKKKVPVEQMTVWQKLPITTPLLPSSHKANSVRTFKVIQHVMFDRDRPVVLPSHSVSASCSSTHGLDQYDIIAKRKAKVRSAEREVILKEIKWLLTAGISGSELRDEVYCQLIKQLTENPGPASMVLGWELLCVLSVTFGPSKTFESYVRHFIESHFEASSKMHQPEVGKKIEVMARFCYGKLMADKPAKGRAPSLLEIESAMGVAFNPSVFNTTLADIMLKQAETYRTERLPVILPFLSNAILSMGQKETLEGIFRVPGNGDQIAMIKDRIDRGLYDLQPFTDPAVPASLLKLWLRELEEPLIPFESYEAAINASEDPNDAWNFVENLPVINRTVLVFVISFLQYLLTKTKQTKMTDINFATIFAPTLLQPRFLPTSTIDSARALPLHFVNSSKERMFILSLLRHLDTSTTDGRFCESSPLEFVQASRSH